jgi:hypothetical protein
MVDILDVGKNTIRNMRLINQISCEMSNRQTTYSARSMLVYLLTTVEEGYLHPHPTILVTGTRNYVSKKNPDC